MKKKPFSPAKPIPMHISHPVEIHAKDGKIYRFTSRDHADKLIERWGIDVVQVTHTKPRQSKTTTFNIFH